jgi:hypothetical protein
MSAQDQDWRIICDDETFGRCKKDARFPYIVTLARAVNALNFANSAMVNARGKYDPAAHRDRVNSYLFGSAIMYEALNLIRAMNQPFRDDEAFQNGLRMLLKDRTAQQIQRDNLNPARNRAVFHFIPETFAEIISKTNSIDTPFAANRGKRGENVNYAYADVVAAEILVGLPSNTEEFFSSLWDAMAKTRDLIIKFTDHAERLIAAHLKLWGFKKE